jgi:hypothetical protein
MPTITVPAETYARLAKLAADRGTTVEAVALPLLSPATPGNDDLLPPEEVARKLKASAELVELGRQLLGDRPRGYEVDCDRESIYEGCGE